MLDIYSASKSNIYMHKIVVILKSSYKYTLIPESGIHTSEIIFSRKLSGLKYIYRKELQYCLFQ